MGKISAFVKRWQNSGGSERGNSQMFLTELCEALDLPVPDPATSVNENNSYCFARKLFPDLGDGKNFKEIDLYRRGSFVLEAKQAQDKEQVKLTPDKTISSAVKRETGTWHSLMLKARNQAENYIKYLPPREGRPPFIIVADIGHCFDFYADFSGTNGIYSYYPNAFAYRIYLKDLLDEKTREFFRKIWNDPKSLDPSARAAKVTEEIAQDLASLAKSLESENYGAQQVSQFLMRCIFTMFAEDTGLIPNRSFTGLLEKSSDDPDYFTHALADLWKTMNEGGYALAIGHKILKFNGSLFARQEVLTLNEKRIAILLKASRQDWREVEPAIFGTLLERALNKKERHKLGAHYTPRAYVERLVMPAVINPLRQKWQGVLAVARNLDKEEKKEKAIKHILDFHRELCAVTVLDPACGSGNFLYVAMEHLKRLEGEIFVELEALGQTRPLNQVGVQQFLGIEVNPRASAIAEMVLRIGFLQWHFRNYGQQMPREPVLSQNRNIQTRDAVLAWKKTEFAKDANGSIKTLWDGESWREDPKTGQLVPDTSQTRVDYTYIDPMPAEWPKCDYIVGNPPFIGNKRMRNVLGDGYVAALHKAYPKMPKSCDFVMYWLEKAAELLSRDKIRRFGFITTNSITQVFNRKITEARLNDPETPLNVAFAIPDHPWVDSADGAGVRIAMTVMDKSGSPGSLWVVKEEKPTGEREVEVGFAKQTGKINSDLSIGCDVTQAKALMANADMSFMGVTTLGEGFKVTFAEAQNLGLGKIKGLEKIIRPYRNGNDINEKSRDLWIIDLFGHEIEEVKELYPEVYQRILTGVKPEREAKVNNTKDTQVYAQKWWLFAKPREKMRSAINNLNRYIVTTQVSKNRFFTFLDGSILPDNTLIVIGNEDAYILGILSSKIHKIWAAGAGSLLVFAPRYNNSLCFSPFPFPDASEAQKAEIRELGEKLDKFRKDRIAAHPDLTMTGLYNVLEADKAGRTLTDKERKIYAQGAIAVLKEIHERLDQAVASAYGWAADADEQTILARLVDLNLARQAEEKRGLVRYLRPEYQSGEAKVNKPEEREILAEPVKTKTRSARTWPKEQAEQMNAILEIINNLQAANLAINAGAIASQFEKAPLKAVKKNLAILQENGQVD